MQSDEGRWVGYLGRRTSICEVENFGGCSEELAAFGGHQGCEQEHCHATVQCWDEGCGSSGHSRFKAGDQSVEESTKI